MKPTIPPIDRRTLLVGGGIGIGLVVGYLAWPRAPAVTLRAGPDERVFGHFLKIGIDGRVTVVVPQVETGQGIWTALPQLVADELGAAWESVGVQPAPIDPVYANPLAGEWRSVPPGGEALRITAGSTSMRAFEMPMRRAGATARALLVAAAAERWDVDPEACETGDGSVVSGARRLGFGALAEAASRLDPPANPPLRPARSGALAGRALPRLDLPAKSDGSFRFAGDVRIPDMLFASVRLAPSGGRLAAFSRAAIERSPGVRGIVADDRWLAVAGDTFWAAERALHAGRPRFEGPVGADRAALRNLFEDTLAAGDLDTLFDRGDYAGAVAGTRPLAATYWAAPTAHNGLEPVTATARFTGDRLEIWAPTLAPDLARATAARAAGDAAAHVLLYPMPVGDSGGRALEADAVPIAVALARRLGRPVQVTLSATTSANYDRLGPPALAKLAALPGHDGLPTAFRMQWLSALGLGAAIARLAGDTTPGALADPGPVIPYAVPNVRIDGAAVSLPFTAGAMRGEPERTLTFFTESFIDELARARRAEPLALRMSLLGGQPRLARCLALAARAGGWDGGGAGSNLGLAVASAYGSHIALLAEASVGVDRSIEVHRLVAAVDCGRIGNAGLVRQQVEGGLLWALGQATAPAPDHVGGIVRARALGALRLPRIARTPAIRVDLVASSADPGGVSGLGATVLAPALANAIAAGTGRRLRSLPFDLGDAA